MVRIQWWKTSELHGAEITASLIDLVPATGKTCVYCSFQNKMLPIFLNITKSLIG